MLFAREAEDARRQGGSATRADFMHKSLTVYAEQVRAANEEAAQRAVKRARGEKETWAEIMALWTESVERESRGQVYGLSGPPDPNQTVLMMHWMTADAQEKAGLRSEARATCREATEWKIWKPILLSIRYHEACMANHDEEDFEASEILRALIEDPRSKDTPLQMAGKPAARDSVYAESVALLEAIRQDVGKSAEAQP